MTYLVTTKDSRGEPIEATINLTPQTLAEFASSTPQQQQLAATVCGQVAAALIPRWQREAQIAAAAIIAGLLETAKTEAGSV